MALSALYGLAKSCNETKNFRHYLNLILSILILLFTLASIARFGGALYQYITKKLKRSCFTIDNGMILQTPFDIGCMRGIDYAIVTITVTSIALLLPFTMMFFYGYMTSQ